MQVLSTLDGNPDEGRKCNVATPIDPYERYYKTKTGFGVRDETRKSKFIITRRIFKGTKPVRKKLHTNTKC